MPAPKKQFSRPSIDLGGVQVKRAWEDVFWLDLIPGDLVADHGTVREAHENPHGMIYKFDHQQRFVPNTDLEKVRAFVRVDG